MCGSWMDRAARPLVIQWGIGLQCAGVGLALCVLGLLVASRPQGASPQGAAAAEAAAGAAAERLPVGLLLAMIGCGSLEVLGAMISSVAVKKDWVTPTLTLTLTLMGNPDPDPDPDPNLNADIDRNPNRNPKSNQLPTVWATLKRSLFPTLPLPPPLARCPYPCPHP